MYLFAYSKSAPTKLLRIVQIVSFHLKIDDDGVYALSYASNVPIFTDHLFVASFSTFSEQRQLVLQ